MAITNGYCALSDIKAALRIPSSDTIDDGLLELAVEAASREIDSATERQFFPTNATRIYTPRDSYIVEIDDLRTVTTLKTSSGADGNYDITWQTSDYQLEPLNGLVGGITTPFTQVRAVGDYTFPLDGGDATVQIVGAFGFATVPTAIKQAAVILGSRIFKRNDSPLGVAGFGDLGVMRVSRIDPDIDALITPYKRIRFA
jgi:hypothetical protein